MMVAALQACLLAAAAFAPASAGAVNVAPAGSASATSIGALTFRSPIATARCIFTLPISFNRGPVAPGGSVGRVTGFSFTPIPCGGLIWAAPGLPWNVALTAAVVVDEVYLVTLQAMQVSVTFLGFTCRYVGDVGLEYTNSTGTMTLLAHTLTGSPAVCGTASFSGTGFAVTPVQTLTG
jgi:hypothetical protein